MGTAWKNELKPEVKPDGSPRPLGLILFDDPYLAGEDVHLEDRLAGAERERDGGRHEEGGREGGEQTRARAGGGKSHPPAIRPDSVPVRAARRVIRALKRPPKTGTPPHVAASGGPNRIHEPIDEAKSVSAVASRPTCPRAVV